MALASIDVHAHYVTPNYAAACRARGHQRPDGMPGIPDWSRDDALRLMDQLGLAASVLSISSPGVDFAEDPVRLARATNDEGAGIRERDPDRFGVVAVLPLSDPSAAAEEADRCITQLATDGVGLLTHCRGRYLGDPTYEPILAELDRHAAVALIHPTSPPCWDTTALGRPRPMIEFLFDTTRAVANLILTGAMDRYPAIRWVIPHCGAALPILADRIQVFAAMSAAPPVDVLAALRRCWYDVAGIATPRSLPALRTMVDDDRLLYGSDYPFTPELAVASAAAALEALDSPIKSFETNAETLFPRFFDLSADRRVRTGTT